MDAQELRGLLASARAMLQHARHPDPRLDVLSGRAIATVFFEHSTRTRGSFAMAAHRVGAEVVDFSSLNSTAKGESLADTVRTIEAMGADAIVVRSGLSGAAVAAAKASGVPILNAGDGRHEHPTQGLLDTFTLCEALGRDEGAFSLGGKRVAIVGDVLHSRVARSSMAAMQALGASITLVGPAPLVPESLGGLLGEGGEIERDFDAALMRADAVMMLRVQLERGARVTSSYRGRFGLTRERGRALRPGTVVMHPGPMNVGLEIDPEVASGACLAEGARSVVLRQVAVGVAVRMAVLCWCLATGGERA